MSTEIWLTGQPEIDLSNPVCRVADDGTEYWRIDSTGCFHRTDGPAVIRPNGRREWWFNGRLHRTDGPAVIDPTGIEEWRYHGDFMGRTVYSFLDYIRISYPRVKLTSAQRMELLLRWG